METSAREQLRNKMDREKELEYLATLHNEKVRVDSQIEQLRRQIGKLTERSIDLGTKWRQGVLSAQATQCAPFEGTEKKKKSVKKTPSKLDKLSKGVKNASPEKLAKLAEILKSAGIEL